MKNTMKKILCSLLVVVMCLTCAPLNGFLEADWSWLDFSITASATWNDCEYFKLSDGTIAIYDYKGTATTLDIPSHIDGIKVTCIYNEAFWGATFESITLPDTITNIGESAFYNCNNLKNMIIPDSVSTISRYAFNGCDKLESLVIGKGVTDLGDGAFNACESLKKVTIPSNIKVISDDAFSFCKNLETVIISDGVISINRGAFCCCYNLKNVTIPDSVTSIKYMAFWASENITDVYYTGTQSQWKKISIGSDNDPLKLANITYNYVINDDENIEDDDFNEEGNATPEGPPIGTYPEGYIPARDSYSFVNAYDTIDIDLYIDAFGPLRGVQLYNQKERFFGKHYLCYGMTSTTAALLKYNFAINSFETTSGSANFLSEIEEKSFSDIFDMDALTYIKYGYIYQFDATSIIEEKNNKDNLKELYMSAKNYTDGSDPLIITIKKKKEIIGYTGHSLFVRGAEKTLDGFKVYVYDPNYPKVEKFINISSDFTSWSYSSSDYSYGSDTGYLTYSFPADVIYNVGLIHGNKSKSRAKNDNSYWSSNNILISSDTSINNENLLEISTPIAGDVPTDNTYYLYWTEENINNFKITPDEDSVITVADVYSSIKATVPENKEAIFEVDDSTENSLICDMDKGSFANISFEFANDTNNITEINISGIVDSFQVTATQSDDDIVITGISNGTVTLINDEQTTDTKEFKNAVSDIEITFDKNGEKEEIDLDYHSHSYTSTVTKESTHLEEGERTYTCECSDNYTEAIEKLEEHTYIAEITKEATHLEEGIRTYTCECSDSYTETIAKLEEHTYIPKITKEPTHLEEGERTYTCECSNSYTETIEKTQTHTYKKTIIKPTCTTEGYTTYTCACNDTYVADKTPLTEHTDLDNNGKCDICDYDATKNCTHICHNSDFMGIIWKIIVFFCKLFGLNKICACGIAHY